MENIDELLVKPAWKRRLWNNNQPKSTYVSSITPAVLDRGRFIEYTQSMFLDELNPSSHVIYDVNYRSNRPKYKYDTEQKKNVFDGYEEVERVSFALQKTILSHKVCHTAGGGIWLGNEGRAEDSERLETLKSYWNLGGMNNAFMDFTEGAFGTGDVAWYLYRNKNEVDFKIFRFDKGDTCVTALDENGNDVFIRVFSYKNNQAVEIYDNKSVKLWIKGEPKEGVKRSNDGYNLIRETIHGLTQCPVAYHREPDVIWGHAQNTINRIEKLMSDLAESGKYYAFQILFLNSPAMSLPNVNFQGKVIGGKTKDADAKILQPADASNVFTIDLDINFKMLWESTNTVIITPDLLKGSNDSGAYLRTLYFPEIKAAIEAHTRMYPALKKVVSIFKEIVGLIEQDTMGYSKMKLSFEPQVFVPSNEMEVSSIVTNQVYARVLSRETAVNELERAGVGEWEKIKKEWDEEIARGADETNPVLPNIDNNAAIETMSKG